MFSKGRLTVQESCTLTFLFSYSLKIHKKRFFYNRVKPEIIICYTTMLYLIQFIRENVFPGIPNPKLLVSDDVVPHGTFISIYSGTKIQLC